MNKPLQITVVDQIQAAERRYYVALQMYDKAIRTVTGSDTLELLKTNVCEAFAEFQTAHDQFVNCDGLRPSANT